MKRLSKHDLFRFSVFVVLGYQIFFICLLSRFNSGRVSYAAPDCRDVHNADEDII